VIFSTNFICNFFPISTPAAHSKILPSINLRSRSCQVPIILSDF
jgi:hypothetical protein